jgi:hypothetical protein
MHSTELGTAALFVAVAAIIFWGVWRSIMLALVIAIIVLLVEVRDGVKGPHYLRDATQSSAQP